MMGAANVRRTGTLALVVLLLIAAGAAQAGVEEGMARHTPWSGYWWPIGKGELLAPLGKYDYLTGGAATQWEQANHPPGPNVPEWFGYCHAWAASAVLEYEPRSPQPVAGPGGQALTLGIGDQKGLLAAAHTQDVANNFGDRFGDGEGSEDFHDLDPCTLWELLRSHMKDQGLPIVMDLEAGPEVWNYPVFAYRVEYSPYGPAGMQMARLSLWAADDAVPPDHVGVMPHFQTYTFTFQVYNGSIVMGSGRWVGHSIENHPDFAWYPYVVMPENPYIEYNHVKHVLGTPAVGAPGASATGTAPGGPSASAILSQDATFLSPIQVVAAIAEKTSAFHLDVTVDRFDGGQYRMGDPMQVRGSSEQAGYLYLFYVNSQGELALLYPRPGQDNRIAAGGRFAVPGPRDPGPFRVAGPPGVHRIKALVTRRALMLTGLVQPGTPQQPGAPQPPGMPQPGAGAGYMPARFRWCPSQKQQVQTLLKKYQKQPELSAKDLVGASVPAPIESFAQDEVAFYVGPPEQ
jgi:hypothetical protein